MQAQPNPIKPKLMKISQWKGLGTFMKILTLSKFPAKNIETLSQRKNMEDTFSSSQDMTEDVDSYLNGGKSLGEQDSLVETWTLNGESGLVELFKNAYKMRTQHQFEESSTKTQNRVRAFKHFSYFSTSSSVVFSRFLA